MFVKYLDYQTQTEWLFSFLIPGQQDELEALYSYALVHHGAVQGQSFRPLVDGEEVHVQSLAQQIEAQKRPRIQQLENLFVEDGHRLGDHHH